jgi:alkyl hydroperoxide reductase subunit AhpC
MRNFENFSTGFMYIREDGMREVCKEYGNVLIAMTGTFLFLAVAETFILGKNGVIALLIRTYMGG